MEEQQERPPKTQDELFKLPFRPTYTGAAFRIFVGGGANANLTDEARQQIMLDKHHLDVERLQAAVEQLKEGRTKHPSMKRPSMSTRSETDAKKPRRNSGYPRKPASILAEHYGVSKNTILKIFKRAEVEPSTAAHPKPGRTKQMSPSKRRAACKLVNESRGRKPLTHISIQMRGKTTWKTKGKVDGKVVVRTSPSPATLSRTFNAGSFVTTIIRKRPKLDAVAIAERQKFAPEALERDDEVTVAHDEAYIQIRMKNGSLMFDMMADTNENPNEKFVEFDSGGKYEPKIFLFGAVTMPKTFVDDDGDACIDPKSDGRVLLARVRGVKKRKRCTKENGQIVPGKNKGDPIYEAVTIDGFRYKRLCEMEGGLFDSIVEYFNPDKPSSASTSRTLLIDLDTEPEEKELEPVFAEGPVEEKFLYISQEDGAPGHGYNNRQGGKETQMHESLVRNASLRGIRLLKQSRHSPEFNNMDLGVWNMLKKAVERRCDEIPEIISASVEEIEDKIWQVVNEEWEGMDCGKLFYIGAQRRVLLEECKRIEGRTIRNEPHTGLRRKYPVTHKKDGSVVNN